MEVVFPRAAIDEYIVKEHKNEFTKVRWGEVEIDRSWGFGRLIGCWRGRRAWQEIRSGLRECERSFCKYHPLGHKFDDTRSASPILKNTQHRVIHQFINNGNWVLIFDCDCIVGPIIDTNSPSALQTSNTREEKGLVLGRINPNASNS